MRFLVYGEYTLIRGFLTGAPNFGDEHSTSDEKIINDKTTERHRRNNAYP